MKRILITICITLYICYSAWYYFDYKKHHDKDNIDVIAHINVKEEYIDKIVEYYQRNGINAFSKERLIFIKKDQFIESTVLADNFVTVPIEEENYLFNQVINYEKFDYLYKNTSPHQLEVNKRVAEDKHNLSLAERTFIEEIRGRKSEPKTE